MTDPVRQGIGRLLLVLVLALQLGVPHAHASSAATPDLTALSRTLGQAVTLCHHGDSDPAHHDGGQDDCCAHCLCHMATSLAGLTPTAIQLVPPVAGFQRPVAATSRLRSATRPFVRATSPRGPPASV